MQELSTRDSEAIAEAAEHALSSCSTQTRSRSSENAPYYVYMMSCTKKSANNPNSSSSKQRVLNQTHIGKSRDPIYKVLRHNEGRVNGAKRTVKKSSPNWCLTQWIGPFQGRGVARQFQKLWFRHAPGTKLRVQRGLQLAAENAVPCYTPSHAAQAKGALEFNTPHARSRKIKRDVL
jgi:hypothetical protein